jgi:transport and Golgi organization protein 2
MAAARAVRRRWDVEVQVHVGRDGITLAAMCLLLALVRVVAGHPLVLVANRDESFDRPSEAPASRGGSPEVWCGIDRRAGGTWLGLNAAGVAVVLTNRRGPQDPSRPSRGAIAWETLASGCCAEDALEAAENRARALRPNPFTLFVADHVRAGVLAYDGPDALPKEVFVGPGLHTTTNTHDLDELSASSVLAVAAGGAVDFPVGIALADAEERLLRIARSHEPLAAAPRSAVCVHADGRGTVSSALLAVDQSGRPARFLAADGPPCATPFRDVLEGTMPGRIFPEARSVP